MQIACWHLSPVRGFYSFYSFHSSVSLGETQLLGQSGAVWGEPMALAVSWDITGQCGMCSPREEHDGEQDWGLHECKGPRVSSSCLHPWVGHCWCPCHAWQRSGFGNALFTPCSMLSSLPSLLKQYQILTNPLSDLVLLEYLLVYNSYRLTPVVVNSSSSR